jgi:hypothetical protein
MSVIAFSRAIGPVPIDVVISEMGDSSLNITEIPIETGAVITDHAVVMPKKVTLDIADSGAAATYAALERFQESRVPFTLVTGLKVYNNMLIKNISTTRDETFSRVLKAKVDLQEVIIVDTAYANDPEGSNGQSGKAGGTKSTKSAAPSSNKAGDAVTADRAANTIQRGDAGTTTAPLADRSLAKSLLGVK